VTVSSSSCTATASVIVTVNTSPTVAPTASPTTICNGSSTTISAGAASGTTPYTYSWNAGSGASHVQSPSSNTTYNVTVTDANSCTATGSISVTVTGTSPLVAVAGNARTICSGTATTLGGSPTASGGSGSFTYAWSGGAGTTANPSVSPTTTTTYIVTVTSATCTKVDSVKVTVNTSPTATPTASVTSICNGGSTVISAGAASGTSPYTYNWSAGSGASHTQTPSSNTTYNVTVTDANSCTATGSVSVTVVGTSPLVANPGNARTICNGASTTLGGSPSGAGGAGTYTYAWSGGAGTTANPVVSPIATTTYILTVTSSTCTKVDSVKVTVNPKPSVAPTAASTSICNGVSTTVDANPTGGTPSYTYSWSPSGTGTSFTASPTATTTYNVTVTDVNSCTASGNVTVTVVGSSPLTANAGSLRTICAGTPTSLGGSPTGNGGNATGTYTYSWASTPAGFTSTLANPSVSPTVTSTYTLTVTNTGCTATSSVVVTVNPKPTAAPTASPTTVCSGSNTTINAVAGGGVSPYTYAWNTTQTAANFVTAPTASTTTTVTYTVTVTDVNNCTVSGSVNVTVNPLPIVSAITPQSVCIKNSGSSIALTAAALTTGQTGAWTTVSSPSGTMTFSAPTSNTTNASTVYPLGLHVYRWTVTALGCSTSTDANVTVNEMPSISAGLDDTICNGASKVLTATDASSGAPNYAWRANTLTSTPISTNNLTTTVAPVVTTNYIFAATLGTCIARDTMTLGVINRPDLINDMTTCQSATEDVAATWPVSNVSSNDINTQVLRGGVTYKIVGAKHGTASISGSNISYTAMTNYNGKDTVVIEGYSNECPSLRDTSIFCVNIAAVNDAPVAKNDTATTVGTAATSISVLANDSDIESTLLGSNVTVVSAPSYGTTTVNA